jgi:hypothetical protein
MLLIYTCDKNDKISLGVRLPLAKNFSTKPSCDSSIFSIELRDSNILIKNHKSYLKTKNFEDIGTFLCNGLKNGNINPNCNFPISLFIDSFTPFPVFDRLIEELKLLDFHAAFLRTHNKGFFIVFPYNDHVIQDLVVKLYGNRFILSKRILYSCKDSLISGAKSEDTLPPPPPPPPPYMVTIEAFNKAREIKSSMKSDYCILEYRNGTFFINKNKVGFDNCIKELYGMKLLFVRLDNDNTYADLIRTIDLISSVQNKKYDDYSLQKFKMKYKNLGIDDSRQIRMEFGIRYLILSLADQKYIDKK